MGMQLFSPRNYDGSIIQLPVGYQRKVKWLPKIGDVFPRFKANTTHGPVDFWEWAEGSWTVVFSHPKAATSICTTELGSLACSKDRFRGLNTKILGITTSTLTEQQVWHRDIAKIYKANVWFPTATDPDGRLANLFGMTSEDPTDSALIRRTIVIDPALRIRAILDYPTCMGRSVDETLRVVEALQTHDRTGFAIPSDWHQGEPVLVAADASDDHIIRAAEMRSVSLLPYLRVAYRR